MHLACLRSNKDVVRFLLVQGIDYNAINKQGKTPRDILQKRSNEQINEQIIKDIDKWSIISDVSPEVMASYRKLDMAGINALFDEHKGGKKSTKSKRKKVKKTKKYRKRTKRR
jgi:ankyrin repeat protein